MYGFVSPADRFASGEDWSVDNCENDDAGEMVCGWNSIGRKRGRGVVCVPKDNVMSLAERGGDLGEFIVVYSR